MFNKQKSFTQDQLNKIGNSIIYFAERIVDLNKTKILKLLYIIEEASIKTTGRPFLGIDFQIWKYGPVAKDIYIDLSQFIDEPPGLLSDYIQRKDGQPETFVPKMNFNDDEFSDHDIRLLERVCAFAKNKSAGYLVQHTHGANSLWRKSALKYGVLEQLENEKINSTDHQIDFSLLFEEDSPLLDRYLESRENLEFSRQLKY